MVLTSYLNRLYNVNGTQNTIFEYRDGIYGNERWELTISAQQPLDIYVNSITAYGSYSVEPSEFDYVSIIKKQSYVSISSDQYPNLSTFAVKVRVHGASHYDNKWYQSSFRVQFVIYGADGVARMSTETEESLMNLDNIPAIDQNEKAKLLKNARKSYISIE